MTTLKVSRENFSGLGENFTYEKLERYLQRNSLNPRSERTTTPPAG